MRNPCKTDKLQKGAALKNLSGKDVEAA